MAKVFQHSVLLFLIILLPSVQYSHQLQSSQAHTLYRIQLLLHYPAVLRSWNVNTDFCNTEWNSSVTVVCYENSVTQLHISGSGNVPPLPKNFSMESFVTTLEKLPDLKVLTLASLGLWGPLPGKLARLSSLEILNVSANYLYGIIPQEVSTLTNLQTLILDNNMFSGPMPQWIDSLIDLAVLSFRNNSFNGSLPNSLGSVENLRVLSLSTNNFSGLVPDLSKLKNLQVLDLGHNALGPEFPRLGSELVILILRSNMFRSGIPPALATLYKLQLLDLSSNTFVGPFPPCLLTLPSLTSLNVSTNKLTGMLTDKLSCNAELRFVDLSSNLLTGSLPKCLQTDLKSNMSVLYSYNCLSMGDKDQNAPSFCHNEALAVGVFPHQNRRRKVASKAVVIASTIGGVLGGIAILAVVLLIVKREHARRLDSVPPARLIAENASTGYTSKFLSDARYISQTMKLGSLGLPAYRTFSLEEIEEATSNFNTSALMGEGSHGQVYKGQLKNGSTVVIRCLKMKKRLSTQSFTHHVELISKLRHHHLVSALGYCFECYLDDSSVSRIFLVFEHVPNGNLRNWTSEEFSGKKLTWAQRIAAVIGVAKGIQFLHTGIVPGVLANDLKITHILLDQNLMAKIGSYNIPLLADYTGKASNAASSSGSKDSNSSDRAMYKDKIDIYDFGIILLEIITGRPFDSRNEVDAAKQLLLASMLTDDGARKSMTDPTIHEACSDESLKTMMDICSRCLVSNPSDRPSIEDVLWNLQFAAQVQNAWRGDSHSSEGSPSSPSHSISQST